MHLKMYIYIINVEHLENISLESFLNRMTFKIAYIHKLSFSKYNY